MFLTAEQITRLPDGTGLYQYGNGWRHAPFNLTTANQIIESVRLATLSNQMIKVNRPWELVDITSSLDPNKTWVGIEYETGWNSNVKYRQVMNHVMDNFNHTVIDREGCGDYAAEITFPPEHLSNLMDGSSKMHRLIAWLNVNRIAPAYFASARKVGIHANISTPSFRKMQSGRSLEVAKVLKYSLWLMKPADLHACFGRVPYGSCSVMNYASNNRWIEFKLFNTTDCLDKLNGYAQIIKRLSQVMTCLSTTKRQLISGINFDARVIINLGDYLLGRTNTLKFCKITARDQTSLYDYQSGLTFRNAHRNLFN